MNYLENKYEILEDIISEIQSRSIEGHWFISFDELITTIDLKKEIFYKTLYSIRKLQYSNVPIKGFSEKEGAHLCLLLDRLLNTNSTSEFFLKSGVFFSESSLEILKDILIKNITEFLENHRLDAELLELLISSTLTFDDAFDSYFDNKINMELLIAKSINTFYKKLNIQAKYDVEILLEKYLQKLLNHNKIPIYKITLKYRSRYYYRMYGKESTNYRSKNSEFYQLLDFFNLNINSSKQELKKKFAQLMKKYHPDVNKEGLEDTKTIIENYNKLQTMLR